MPHHDRRMPHHSTHMPHHGRRMPLHSGCMLPAGRQAVMDDGGRLRGSSNVLPSGIWSSRGGVREVGTGGDYGTVYNTRCLMINC